MEALLGNHEVQLLAAHRFGSAPVAGWDEPEGFRGGWARFGGCEEDLRRLAPEHIDWILGLPAAALVDGHLLVHSDTARYLEFGSTVAEVNTAVATALSSPDPAAWLEFSRRMSSRGRSATPRPRTPVIPCRPYWGRSAVMSWCTGTARSRSTSAWPRGTSGKHCGTPVAGSSPSTAGCTRGPHPAHPPRLIRHGAPSD